jgi:hypothetical protein
MFKSSQPLWSVDTFYVGLPKILKYFLLIVQHLTAPPAQNPLTTVQVKKPSEQNLCTSTCNIDCTVVDNKDWIFLNEVSFS